MIQPFKTYVPEYFLTIFFISPPTKIILYISTLSLQLCVFHSGPTFPKNSLKSLAYFHSFLNMSKYLHSLYSTEYLSKKVKTDFYQPKS